MKEKSNYKMRYRTKPVSRKTLRDFAVCFRQLFQVPNTGPLPVLHLLERLPDVFDNCYYIIVEDEELDATTMARCEENEQGGCTIKIKRSVYDGAYQEAVGEGAFRGFICHELCHIFLFKIGYTPMIECSLSDETIPAYEDVEWQAKALCDEAMIPYEESRGMSRKEMIEYYKCSQSFADYRLRNKEQA